MPHACVPWDCSYSFLRGITRQLSTCGFELGGFSEEVMLHRLREVFEQMPAIGRLLRIGSALFGSRAHNRLHDLC